MHELACVALLSTVHMEYSGKLLIGIIAIKLFVVISEWLILFNSIAAISLNSESWTYKFGCILTLNVT